MADGSTIEWTDATWNPVTGCSVVSPGCTNCYAMRLAGTRLQHHHSRAGLTSPSKAGPVWNGQVRLNEGWLTQPLAWSRPRRIFVCAHGDLFHESVPDDWIDRVFAVMALAPQHTFQVLTKRSARMRAYLQSGRATPVGMEAMGITLDAHAANPRSMVGAGVKLKGDIAHLAIWPLPNVWLGVSAEDQRRADERIPDLLATPAAVRFVSAEPLLGSVDLTRVAAQSSSAGWIRFYNALRGFRFGSSSSGYGHPRLDWVIAGGESGPSARPMNPQWARDIRDQCAEAGVLFHFKQWGEWADMRASRIAVDGPVTDRWGNVRDWMSRYVVFDEDAGAARVRGHSFTDHATDLVYRVGKARAGRHIDGVEHNGMPGEAA